MAAKETTVYPVTGRWLHDHPAAVHTVATKAEADELVASGAFTDDSRSPDRNHDAPDLTAAPTPEAEVPAADRPAGLRHADADAEAADAAAPTTNAAEPTPEG